MSYAKYQARVLIRTLLEDEHGVSEKAYQEIRDLMDCFGLTEEFRHVDATDGRFYISENDSDQPKFVDDRVL